MPPSVPPTSTLSPPAPGIRAALRSSSDARAADVLRALDGVSDHPLFARLRTADDVRRFMEVHVFAVWDFMSLLKSVQAAVAPTSVPWRPAADPEIVRFVNEVVLGEESDELPGGGHGSHFDAYLDAMEAAGVDTGPIRGVVETASTGAALDDVLAAVPTDVRPFVQTTFDCIEGPPAVRVAALAIGREEVIPDMFTRAVSGIADGSATGGGRLDGLLWYLRRHIEVDGEDHGPLTARLYARVCAADAATERASLEAALACLAARRALWDAALRRIDAD